MNWSLCSSKESSMPAPSARPAKTAAVLNLLDATRKLSPDARRSRSGVSKLLSGFETYRPLPKVTTTARDDEAPDSDQLGRERVVSLPSLPPHPSRSFPRALPPSPG